MRCSVGPKKVARYKRETGLPVLAASVRGNSDHIIILLLEDGTTAHWDRKTGEIEKPKVGWDVAAWKAKRA